MAQQDTGWQSVPVCYSDSGAFTQHTQQALLSCSSAEAISVISFLNDPHRDLTLPVTTGLSGFQSPLSLLEPAGTARCEQSCPDTR